MTSSPLDARIRHLVREELAGGAGTAASPGGQDEDVIRQVEELRQEVRGLHDELHRATTEAGKLAERVQELENRSAQASRSGRRSTKSSGESAS